MIAGLWLVLAILAGATAPRMFPKRRGLATAVAMFLPPLLLCLYFITTADEGDPWESLMLPLVVLVWVVAAGIAGLTAIAALRRRDKRA